MAESREARVGGSAGGVHGDNAATATAGGATQDVEGEGVVVKSGPVEATGGTTLLLLRGRYVAGAGGKAVTTGRSAA